MLDGGGDMTRYDERNSGDRACLRLTYAAVITCFL
jgi:hypothetical protein